MSMPLKSAEEKIFNVKIGSRLHALREDRKLNMKDIAEIIGCSLNHYSRIEKGEASLSPYQCSVICDYYNISPNKLYGRLEMNKAEYSTDMIKTINAMNKEQKHLLLEIAKNVMMFDCKQKKDIGDLLQK
ncbi:MAG: helix-turn-helix transcriptional regulator [Dorea sp.]